MPESCDEMEILISRAMDGECGPEGLETLKRHLAECPECRATMRAYQRMDLVLQRGSVPAAPPCPPVHAARRPAAWKTAMAFAAAAVIAAVAFIGGSWWDGQKTARDLPAYSRVASAARWEKAADPVRREAARAALPLSEAVSGYQQEVARLLREENVDWDRVRRLVEAIGALRTDMELLTLHVAYLEGEKGKSGSASAAWSGLLGLSDRGGSL